MGSLSMIANKVREHTHTHTTHTKPIPHHTHNTHTPGRVRAPNDLSACVTHALTMLGRYSQ